MTIAADDKKADDKKDDEEGRQEATRRTPASEAARRPTIDFDGLAGARDPRAGAADNYASLAADRRHLIYIRSGAVYLRPRRGDATERCRFFALKDRKETTLAEGIDGYALSADGAKAAGATRRRLRASTTLAKGKRLEARPVSTAGLVVDRVPAEEWAEIFDEVWRRYRDFFYVENMHGYDWEALREQYQPLLAYVAPPLRPQLS